MLKELCRIALWSSYEVLGDIGDSMLGYDETNAIIQEELLQFYAQLRLRLGVEATEDLRYVDAADFIDDLEKCLTWDYDKQSLAYLGVLTRTQNLIEIYEGVSPPPRKPAPRSTPELQFSNLLGSVLTSTIQTAYEYR